MSFMIYKNIIHLRLNASRKKSTSLVTTNVACYKIKDSGNLNLSLFHSYATKQTTSSTNAI